MDSTPLGFRVECCGGCMRLACKSAGDCYSNEQMLMCRIKLLDASPGGC